VVKGNRKKGSKREEREEMGVFERCSFIIQER